MSEVKLNTGIGKKASFKSSIDLRAFIIVFALIAIWGILGVVTKGTFLSSRNLSLLFRQMSTIAVIAVGMVLVIVAGHIDLSVGSIVAFCGAVSAIMQSKMGMGTVWAIIVPILIGVLFAAWNGYWAAYQKVPPFIVTLASMLLFRGFTLIITGGSTISSMNPSFKYIGDGYLSPRVGIALGVAGMAAYILLQARKRHEKTARNLSVDSRTVFILKLAGITVGVGAFITVMNSYEGIPVPVILFIIVTLIISFIATRTRFGRRLYAIGGNPEAARLSGINVKWESLKIYLVLGALSALSGLILTSRLDAATPSAGNQFEFDAISAAIIGGTSFMGGEGTVFGALIGSLIMASLNNGMSILNMPTASQYILKGLVLMIAVWVDIKARLKGQ